LQTAAILTHGPSLTVEAKGPRKASDPLAHHNPSFADPRAGTKRCKRTGEALKCEWLPRLSVQPPAMKGCAGGHPIRSCETSARARGPPAAAAAAPRCTAAAAPAPLPLSRGGVATKMRKDHVTTGGRRPHGGPLPRHPRLPPPRALPAAGHELKDALPGAPWLPPPPVRHLEDGRLDVDRVRRGVGLWDAADWWLFEGLDCAVHPLHRDQGYLRRRSAPRQDVETRRAREDPRGQKALPRLQRARWPRVNR